MRSSIISGRQDQPTLAFSTSMLQQLAVLGLLFLYFRLEGDRANRRH
jgi:hypothetical protein